MRMPIIIIAVISLAGCTTTSAQIAEKPVVLTISSAKAPEALANCLADAMTGASVRSDGAGHWWVVRENNFGAIGRWDIYAAGAGSRAEWRRVSSLTTGSGAGAKCT